MAQKKVLIAEDSSVIQNLTKKILQFQNFDIQSVKNGKELLDAVETQNYDVILLDINMPIMDGIQAVTELRQHADAVKKATPVIAITGNAANHSVDYLKSVGFTEYLQKPLNFDHLVELVKKYTN